jgi:hypothetical protein
MKITTQLREDTGAPYVLMVTSEKKAFNVLESPSLDGAFLNCTFEQLNNPLAHYEIASRFYKTVSIDLAGYKSAVTPISNLVLICSKACNVSLVVADDCSISTFKELFALIMSEAEHRYACLKGKKVGDYEWPIA